MGQVHSWLALRSGHLAGLREAGTMTPFSFLPQICTLCPPLPARTTAPGGEDLTVSTGNTQ